MDTGLADRLNMVYMGTHVAYGKGKAVVVATGMGTELGRIADKIAYMENDPTPLQKKLDVIGKQIGVIVLVVCVVIFAMGLLNTKEISRETLIYLFMVSVAVAVAAVPEGLPAVVTVALAKGMRSMAKKNALVKRLSAVETLGSTTVICSDKTGTLTRNEMTVRRIYLGGRSIDVSGEGYNPEGEFTFEGKPFDRDYADMQLLLRIAALCNNSSLENVDGRWRIVGDPTEAALLVVASKAGISYDVAMQQYPRVAEIPFSSERKRMSTVHVAPSSGRVVYVKGGPDIVLSLCTRILVDGDERPMSEADRKAVLAANEAYAGSALRVLAVAFRPLADHEEYNSGLERDLVFVGLLGMIDPPREDATAAVHVAREAGIKIVIITGDHLLTAVAVAKEMGIYHDGDRALTGSELEKLSDADFASMVEDIVIYARVSPEHKLRIVSALKAGGHIVAMTGDGVNDAPALKKADIGIAMGVTGTDVAKEAGDMVLVDDNFASIVAAVEEGRGIYANIQLFIKFLLSGNISEVLAIFVAMLAWSRIPLTALQILVINLLTDAAPAIALAWNPVDPGVMKRAPRDPDENIISVSNFANFLFAGGFIAAITLGLFYFSSEEKAVTMAFAGIITAEMFYSLSCRSEKSILSAGLFSNRYLILAVVFSFVSQLVLIYVPVFQDIFNTVPLGFGDWMNIVAVSSTVFILPEIWKIIRKR